MDLLSLQGPRELPARRLTRAEAITASLALHLLLVLFVTYVPDRLPESVLRILKARPPSPAAPVTDLASAPADAAARERRRRETERIPLKFAYVRVPDDVATQKNPDAALLSDKDRRARQEIATPRDARLFTRDPHSEGRSRDRVRTDPLRPEGPDTPNPAPTSGGQRAGESKAVPPEGRRRDQEPADRAEARPGAVAGGTLERPPTWTEQQEEHSPTGPADGGAEEREGPPGGDPDRTSPDKKPQTEYKFTFSNPGFLRGGAYGTLSFDTQGFPWGEYARQIYVIIRNNWFARIPLAAREGGLAGYTCQRFVIAREGAILSIDVVRPSPIPPFNRAATDALRASSPLPPLPDAFTEAQEGATFCFFYNMYPAEAE